MSLFSIVTPSYNRPDFLGRLLDSICRQTIQDFDVFVIDDASQDRDAYAYVINHFSQYISLRYFRNEVNRGAQYSRNRGVAESSGELIAFVDDDDEWMPRKLEQQAALFSAASAQLGLVYTWADAVNEESIVTHSYRAFHHGNVLAALLDACFIPSPTVIVRRAVIEKLGGFDESLPSCQDWDMWIRIADAGFHIDVVKDILALHHKHQRASIGASGRSLEGFFRFYEKHADLYKRLGMARNLSEKYRGLAYQADKTGHCKIAQLSLRRSITLWKTNIKAWVRYIQFFSVLHKDDKFSG